MSRRDRQQSSEPGQSAELPRALVEYAEQMLLGTGLTAADAVTIASGQADGPAELRALAEALRAGWSLAEDKV